MVGFCFLLCVWGFSEVLLYHRKIIGSSAVLMSLLHPDVH